MSIIKHFSVVYWQWIMYHTESHMNTFGRQQMHFWHLQKKSVQVASVVEFQPLVLTLESNNGILSMIPHNRLHYYLCLFYTSYNRLTSPTFWLDHPTVIRLLLSSSQQCSDGPHWPPVAMTTPNNSVCGLSTLLKPCKSSSTESEIPVLRPGPSRWRNSLTACHLNPPPTQE